MRTPNEVAADLGVTSKQLRDWLRATYPRRDDEWHSRWYLTSDMVSSAREHFS